MATFQRTWSRMALAACIAAAVSLPANGQLYQYRGLNKNPRPRSTPSTDSNTHITVELFTISDAVRFQAQFWEPVFEHAGVPVRIRQGTSVDKIAVREKQYGKLREVFVVGQLDRNGRIVVPDRSFAKSESAALEEWLRELKAYGAQGSPAGKPMWGLSPAQFDEVYKALATPVDRDVADLGLDEAIRALRLPERYPVRQSLSAEKALAKPGWKQRPSRLSLRGFTRGTALAMLVSQYGLGFRPNRTPGGALELRCFAAEAGDSFWPIGWDHLEGETSFNIAPKLFNQTKVELKDQKLIDVLAAIAEQTSTPVLVDFARIEGRGLDVTTVLVNVKLRRMTWSQLLTGITSPSFLQPLIRCDEMKRPFVWITPLANAPAHVVRPRSDRPKTDSRATGRRPPSTVDPLSDN